MYINLWGHFRVTEKNRGGAKSETIKVIIIKTQHPISFRCYGRLQYVGGSGTAISERGFCKWCYR